MPLEFLACVETVLTAQSGEAKKLQSNKPLYSQSGIYATLQDQTPQGFLVLKNNLSVFHEHFLPPLKYFLQLCL